MANAPAASAGRPNNEHESDDEEEAIQTSAPERDPSNCVEPGNASHYGQFTWTVALPAAPADKDSLADISKIRQFRFCLRPWLPRHARASLTFVSYASTGPGTAVCRGLLLGSCLVVGLVGKNKMPRLPTHLAAAGAPVLLLSVCSTVCCRGTGAEKHSGE
jgi:hypothetical protein